LLLSSVPGDDAIRPFGFAVATVAAQRLPIKAHWLLVTIKAVVAPELQKSLLASEYLTASRLMKNPGAGIGRAQPALEAMEGRQ